jgi:hypothetical protein
MPATDLTPLITDSQAVAPLQPPAAQHCATIFGFHTRQKSVLTAARNTFGLPCSLGHWRQPHNIHMLDSRGRRIHVPLLAFRLATEAAATGCAARLRGRKRIRCSTATRAASVSIFFIDETYHRTRWNAAQHSTGAAMPRRFRQLYSF